VPRWYFNLFLVFLISGLWHGANWTYVIWGALNGSYLILGVVSQRIRNKINETTGLDKLPIFKHLPQILITFLLSCFAWIFFRANNFSDALSIIHKISILKGPLYFENPSLLIYSCFGIFLLFCIELKHEFYRGNFHFFSNSNGVIRNFSYAMLIIIILVMGVFDGGQFIYFQF
jgi:alginate O-acetyltransferase complex protein AlgI